MTSERYEKCESVVRVTYIDAVESAIVEEHGLVQVQFVALVIPRSQDLVSCARTVREKLLSRHALRQRNESEKSGTDEPSALLPAHC